MSRKCFPSQVIAACVQCTDSTIILNLQTWNRILAPLRSCSLMFKTRYSIAYVGAKSGLFCRNEKHLYTFNPAFLDVVTVVVRNFYRTSLSGYCHSSSRFSPCSRKRCFSASSASLFKRLRSLSSSTV
jgi:hypothetical protein